MTAGNIIRKINPATLEVVGEIPEIEPEMLPEILESAREAQRMWATTPLKVRVANLIKLKKLIIFKINEIAHVISDETGKPKAESIWDDIFTAISATQYCIDQLPRLFRTRKIDFGKMKFIMNYMHRTSYIQPQPLGVIAIISPWNYPLGIPFSQTIMSVAAGNAVVLKPSSDTPFTGLKIQELFNLAGFPKGLVQTIPGSGSRIGNALLTSEVDKIIFTGSVETGKKVMELASQRLTPVTLELGGKDPFIVCEDADFNRAINAASWGSFLNCGQTCVGTKRIYVQSQIYERFLQAFKAKVETLKQGYGWDDPDISVGPLITERALNEMEGHVTRAIEQGARILSGGERASDLTGFYFKPTVICNAKQDMDVVQQEIFGPIVVILPFNTDEEAIQMANDSPFGLSGAVWSRNIPRAKHIAEQLSGGSIDVNNVSYTYGLMATPWGGKKNSGFGRTHSMIGFEELIEPHHIHVDLGTGIQDLWWQPYDQLKLDTSYPFVDFLFGGKWTRFASLFSKFKKIMGSKSNK